MLVQVTLWLVERDRWQFSGGGILQEAAVKILQMLSPVCRMTYRVHIGVVIEWLMMELEVRGRNAKFACAFGGVQRLVPGTGIPGPADTLGAQQITDIGLCQRRQGRGAIGICIQMRAVISCGRHIAWLVGRLHGVDRIEHSLAIGWRQRTVIGVLRRTIQSGFARPCGRRQSHEVAIGIDIDTRNTALGRRLIGIRIFWRTGTNQILMIQEGTTESTHEEIIGQRVLLGQLPHCHVATVVIPQRQAASVRISGKLIVLAIVNLHLVIVKTMHQVTGNDAAIEPQAICSFNPERFVGQTGRLCLGQHLALPWHGCATPGRRQHWQDSTIDVDLGIDRATRGRIHTGNTVGAWEQTIQVIETAIFCVNDHQGIDIA